MNIIQSISNIGYNSNGPLFIFLLENFYYFCDHINIVNYDSCSEIEESDVLFYDYHQYPPLSNILENLTDEQRESLRKAKCVITDDYEYQPDHMIRELTRIDNLGIFDKNDVILVSNILDSDIRKYGIDKKCGRFKRIFGSLVYSSTDYYNKSTFDRTIISPEIDHDAVKLKKKFLCLNRARGHRVALVSFLYSNNIDENSLISLLYGRNVSEKLWKEYHYNDLLNFYKKQKNSFYGIFTESDYVSTLNRVPVILDRHDNSLDLNIIGKVSHKNNYSIDYRLFNSTHVSLISESFIKKSFLTEKTLVRIANAHPFLILSGCGSHLILEELGFKIYRNLMLNDFDNEVDDLHRFRLYCENIKMINDMDDDEFNARMVENRRMALKNRDLFLNKNIAINHVDDILNFIGE